MGGNGSQQQPQNPIIPDTGAADYWYVDPSAQGIPGPNSWNPNAQGQLQANNDYFNLLMNQLYQQMKSRTEYDPTIDSQGQIGYADDTGEEGITF